MSRLKRSTASSRAVIQGTTGSYALVDDISSDTEVVVSRADFVRLHVSEKRGGSSDGEDNAGKTHRLHKLHSFRRGEYRENAQVKFGAASFTGLAMASRVAVRLRGLAGASHLRTQLEPKLTTVDSTFTNFSDMPDESNANGDSLHSSEGRNEAMQDSGTPWNMVGDAHELAVDGLRGKFAKEEKSSGNKVTWITIDHHGQLKTDRVKRPDKAKEHGLRLRDLRLLDPEFSTSYASVIHARTRAIVVNLVELKLVISQTKEVIMRPASNSRLKDLIHALQHTFLLQSKRQRREESLRANEDARRSLEESLNTHSQKVVKTNWKSSHRQHFNNERGTPNEEHGDDADADSVAESSDDNAESSESEGELENVGHLDVAQRAIRRHKRKIKKNKGLPFELRALEICLEICMSALVEEAEAIDKKTRAAAQQLFKSTSLRGLNRVRLAKTGLSRLTGKVENVRNAIQSLLDSDEDIHNLHLTERRRLEESHSEDAKDDMIDVSEAVDILDSNFALVDGVRNNLQMLDEYVQHAEEFVTVKLNAHRNKLEQVELLFVSGTFMIALFALITGTFGMNLKHGLEEEVSAFYYSVGIAGAVCLGLYAGLLVFFRTTGLLDGAGIFFQDQSIDEGKLNLTTKQAEERRRGRAFAFFQNTLHRLKQRTRKFWNTGASARVSDERAYAV